MSDDFDFPGLRVSTGPGDPRLHDIDADFRALLDEFGTAAATGRLTRKRVFHTRAAVLRGVIRFFDVPGVPVHPFYAGGRRYPVLARYSSGVSSDDLAPGIRGLSLRWLDPGNLTDNGGSPFSLTFNTGARLFAPDASTFVRFVLGDDAERADIVRSTPDASALLWDQIRDPVSLSRYHYHSQVPRIQIDATGRPWLARYRLVPVEDLPDPGRHAPHGRLFPPTTLLRDSAETRSSTFLRDEVRRLADEDSVRALFQIQLFPVGGDAEANLVALTPSSSWSMETYPFRSIGEIRFDEALDEPTAEGVLFDPAVAPEGLGIALARSPHEPASVNHARTLVYRAAHASRRGARPPRSPAPEVPAPGGDMSGTERTICVVGAGPGGLSAAYELERLGHTVVVLEQAEEVGGKSVSVDVDGRAYDLGAHLCTTRYQELARLAGEFGLDTEDTTLTQIYDTATFSTRLPSAAFFTRDGFGRYARTRTNSFDEIARPGLAHSARALAQPVREWLRDNDFGAMATSFEAGYTSSGYGYLSEDLPALYFVKHAEMTGLLSPDSARTRHDGTFTVAGGFGKLWRRVADELADVRTGVEITAIDRGGDGVRVRTASGVVRADDLVLAVPLDRLAGVLDTTPAEDAVASKVRVIDYYTVLCRISGLPRDGLYLTDDGAGAPPRGHCVAYHNRYCDTDVYTCYSYGAEGTGAEEITANLREDVARLGGEVTEVLVVRRWPFFPHFASEDVADGIYDRLEALQGRRRTYHVGGLPAYELIETTVAYSRELVVKFLGGKENAAETDSADIAGDAVETSGPSRSAADIRTWLVHRLAGELELVEEEIDAGAPLENYPLDSLAIAGLQAELSDWLGFRVPPTLLLEYPTLEVTARRLAESLPDKKEPEERSESGTATPFLAVPLTPPRPFFCVGGSSGAAYQLLPLARALGPWQPFSGLQSPGYDGAEPVLDTVEAIAERYVEDIRAVQPRGPYLVGGYSFGGLVAYEIGRRLREAGEEVAEIVLIDSYLPTSGQDLPVWDENAALGELVAVHRAMAGIQGEGLFLDPGLSLDERRDAVYEELEISGVLGARRQLDRLLPVYQANLEANVRYRPPDSDLPVTLLRAGDPFPPVFGRARRPAMPLGDPAHGWAGVRTGGFRVVDVPGGHFTIFTRDRVDGLAAALRQVLSGDRVLTEVTS
ncbi:hypothetical protein CFN78_23090 [Amycolatopsis antarctica]|uniref:Carrier domain-containing protein n=1 Tax=Amycolatopsis antarctica TaxID=1854586 RepID=A0A263CXD5_9PSEU|nr:FAD-dependent oxidoreductase [Amycolatopsis antarctica]OZM70810.1 hypothetical protein CFN78_23090 [Amycolatopsis antarctica]